MISPPVVLNEDATLTWLEIGEGVPVLVIDDVFKNAEELRTVAWARRFKLPRGPMAYYPGWLSAADLPGEKLMMQWIAKLFLDRLWPSGWPAMISTENLSPNSFFAAMAVDRLAAANNQQADVRVEGHSWLATQAYLFDAPTGADARGTAFWRHKPTGLHTFFPGDLLQVIRGEELLGLGFLESFRKATARIAANTFEDAKRQVFHTKKSTRRFASTDEDQCWALLHFVEGKFNRLVAHPTWQMHSIIDMTAHNPITTRNARLTYNNFIEYPLASAPAGVVYTGKGYLPVEGMSST